MDLSLLEINGWVKLNLLHEGDVGDRILDLRSECLSEFVRLARMGGVLDGASHTSTGQYGFTSDGHEGRTELKEVRSHLVFNWPVPESHPLALLSPHFYGQPIRVGSALDRLADSSARLSANLDKLMLRVFSSLEEQLDLDSGYLQNQMLMGERLLRYQWYPRLRGSVLQVDEVDLGKPGRLPITTVVDADGARLVRVTPHRDIGHWTWQVAATDSMLRFGSEATALNPAADENEIVGNVCEYLTLQVDELPSPFHWVDLDETCFSADRASISYFAHARPSVRIRDVASGALLFESLHQLGYVSHEEVESAVRSLESLGDDPSVVRKIQLWERNHGTLPPGFGVMFTHQE